MTPPEPRPALRRADDADLHPVLATTPAREAPTRRLRPVPPPVGPPRKGKKGTKYQGAGKSTSDSLRPTKLASLKVDVPKAVRRDIRAIAKESGTTPDALVTEILTGWLGDPRRW